MTDDRIDKLFAAGDPEVLYAMTLARATGMSFDAFWLLSDQGRNAAPVERLSRMALTWAPRLAEECRGGGGS